VCGAAASATARLGAAIGRGEAAADHLLDERGLVEVLTMGVVATNWPSRRTVTRSHGEDLAHAVADVDDREAFARRVGG
jgi:hypothetical protein